jgi:hypothetical protein
VDQEVAVIDQHPLRLAVAFDAQRQFAAILQPQRDLVADGLNLARIRSGADDKTVGKGGKAGQIQYLDIRRLLRFRGTNCFQPG